MLSGQASGFQISNFEGLRITRQRCSCTQLAAPVSGPARRFAPLKVVANKKVVKKRAIVLAKDVPEVGTRGTLTSVPVGYWRNYLQPQGLAFPATEGILANLQREKEAQERAALQVKAKAKAMAVALQTIGKFIVRKKVGENDHIFGSVTTQEIVDAIEMQTGRKLDKKAVLLPEIKTTGTFDASIKLHPEVVGSFKVVVQKEKGAS